MATRFILLASALFVGGLLCPPHRLAAQDDAPEDAAREGPEGGVVLTIGGVGIGVGDVPRLNGLRLNFRDRDLRLVNGVNATIWSPHRPARGAVNGLALGLPVTGARRITGVGLGLGVGADEEFQGLAIAPLGAGAGENMTGVLLGGLGVGTGGEVTGVALGGLGVGTGGRARGIIAGGLGAGAGGGVAGVALGGLGVGAGESVDGVAIGGLGVAAGGAIRGLAIGGLGVGAGGGVTGVSIGGLGVGAGGEVKWLNIGGIGVAAPKITGLTLAGVGVGSDDVAGVTIAPLYFRVEPGGTMRGVSVSAFNRIGGAQHGLAIGILNIAEELDGLQLGLINIARNKPSFRVLPFANYHRVR